MKDLIPILLILLLYLASIAILSLAGILLIRVLVASS